jgi:hypothetical protein
MQNHDVGAAFVLGRSCLPDFSQLHDIIPTPILWICSKPPSRSESQLLPVTSKHTNILDILDDVCGGVCT